MTDFDKDKLVDNDYAESNGGAYGSIQEEEKREEQAAAADVHVYKARWYIIFVFSYVTVMQNIVWNSFGPISKPTERVYEWQDWEIAITNNLAPAAFLLTIFPWAWFMDTKGLRPSMLITAALIFVGSGIRCFTFQPGTLTTVIVFFGAFLNGLASIVILAAPPLISALWFPIKERTTATSIASQFGFLGIASSFLFDTYMVPDTAQDAQFHYPNNTAFCNGTHNFAYFDKDFNKTMCTDIEEERDRMSYFMYTQTAMSALMLLLVVVYFPNHPPKPPSPSAAVERLDFMQGLKRLLRNGQFWLIVLGYGMLTGSFFGWLSVLDVSLKHLDVSQNDAGLIGFLMQLVGSIVAVIVAYPIDYIGGHLKKIAMVLVLGALAFFTAFLFVAIGVIEAKTSLIYGLLITGAVFFQPNIPIFYEMAVESAYPVAEGVSGGLLQLCPQATVLILLLFFLIPNSGTTWLNYFIVTMFTLTIPLLWFFKESRKRSELDQKHETQDKPWKDLSTA